MRASQTLAWAASLGVSEEAQPEALLDPGASGTCVPGDQAAVWIHPDPLPWTDEECRPGEHADGLGQPVLAAQAAADYLRGVTAQNTLRADDEAQTGGIRRQNTVKK